MDSQVKQLLIIDDEPILLKSLKREIEQWIDLEKISIFIFSSPKEALIHLEKYNKDIFLVISDLRMPEMKGSDFLSNINAIYPDIILFLLTAYSDIAEIQKAISASISRLILKPWDSVLLKSDIENALDIYTLRKQNALLRKEIDHNIQLAGEFQKRLLTGPIPRSEDIKIEMLYKPVCQLHCGGDFYDFFDIDDDRKIIMIGDVSGHGIKPAFVTAMLKVLCSMLRPTFFEKPISTAEIMSYINDGIFKSLDGVKDILTSFSVVYINHLTKRIQITGAGQLPIYIKRGETLLSLKNEGIVMGFQYGYEYTELSQNIKSDDLIILFTDGLIESEKKRKRIQEDIIKETLSSLDLDENPTERIYNCFSEMQEKESFSDDITLITVKIS